MGGYFGLVSKQDCVNELFFGTDYHSHLGTRRGGMAVYSEKNGFQRHIHNIENSPFRTKFQDDLREMDGKIGIGCISDTEPQPLIVRSHLGNYAITTVGRINNIPELVDEVFSGGGSHFLEMSGGRINATELMAALINQKDSIEDGIRYAQQKIDGSMSLLLMTKDGIYAARDLGGKTPVVIGQKEGAVCAAFESFSFSNLGYSLIKELGAGEIVFFDADGVTTLKTPIQGGKICAFLWTYYGYPPSCYEGINVEQMRYNTGAIMAMRDNIALDYVAGVPDSGTAAAVGYASASGYPFARPFIKYTPTWQRSFMPVDQSMRDLVAKLKLIQIEELIKNKRLLFIDDSIVRGTQMRDTAQLLYGLGAEEVHVRSSCPPILFGCKYLNFSRSTGCMELIARRVIEKREGKADDETVKKYLDESGEYYALMVEDICKELHFTSLRYNFLNDMIKAIGLQKSEVCTYCWNGVE